MSDAGSGSRFPFLKRNRNDDTPSDFSQRMDLNSPVTGEINQIFTPSQPRHAAAPSDATSDFPAMPTSTEGMDENTEREYAMALAQGMSLPFVDLNEYQVDKEVISMVPDDLCRRNQLLPLSIVNGRITVAMANPKNFAAIDDVSASTGMPVIPMVAMPSQVKDAINRYLRANAELTELSHEIAATAKKEVDLESDSGEDASPVARFVSLLINQAIDDHCSDIHIEPQEDGLLVRYRIDGVLHVFQKAPKAMTQGVISRIKVMSDMDIGERRKPQDGRITVKHNGQKVDLRVAALPTVWGEKIVMRILSTPSGNLKVEDLNFSQRNFDVFSKAYNRPYGLVLVTGPTGSGKSTTLYATLGDVAKPEINIITVEDPVEFRMRGINQVQVNNKAGMTFAAALRSILRADPDVVLIGEIRDQETISTALTAVETGHLVFATLHTQDAGSTVDRLIDVYPENQQQQIRVQVASTLRAVIVQTLIPRASGHGRAPATEVMINNPAVAALIRSGKAHQIRTVLQSGEKEGMHTLDQDLARLVNKGVITFEDALVKVQVREEFEKLCGARKSF